MWSEDADKKIRDAAENDMHEYEDKNWQKMENLLDKHLPQKKDRRKGLIFFLLAGLLLSTAIYFVSRDASSGTKPVSEQKNIPASPSSSAVPQDQNTGSVPGLPAEKKPEKTSLPPGNTSEPALSSQNDANIFENVNSAGKTSRKRPAISETPFFSVTDIPAPGKQTKDRQLQADTAIARPPAPVTVTVLPAKGDTGLIADPLKDPGTVGKTMPPLVKADDPQDSLMTAPGLVVDKKKPARKPSSRLSFNFSAGPDISSAGLKPGRLQMQYGIGLGYSFSERLTLRTGFYAARKLYSADSNSYKTPFNSGPYSYRLYNVDADCLVYEIPVTIAYSFAASKKHNWFVAAGLSSYIMKKEEYDYTYKNPAGQTLLHSYTYKNEYTHLFSVVNLSGGYQHHFSKRFSLLAEPYIKMPIGGIGFGKVKLNSAGILFTASFKPF